MQRIQYHRYGGPEVLRLEQAELQSLGRGKVAVRVRAAAINPIDWKLRQGDLKMMTGSRFPRGMGSDFAGEVVAVGPGVSRFGIGDPVFGLASLKDSGAFAEAVVTTEAFLARKPDRLEFEEAACLPTVAVTAWNALVDKAGLQPGQRVFVNGCTGGVGLAAVQIALAHGAIVSGSCRASMIAEAEAGGVSEAHDYAALDWSRLKGRFDIVLDTAGTLPIAEGLSILSKRGALVEINVSPSLFLRSMIQRRLKPVVCSPRAEVLDTIAGLAAGGALRLPIAERADLRGALDLIRRFEERTHATGKGVILVV